MMVRKNMLERDSVCVCVREREREREREIQREGEREMQCDEYRNRQIGRESEN